MPKLVLEGGVAGKVQVKAAILLALRYSAFSRLAADKQFQALLEHQLGSGILGADAVSLGALLEVLRTQPGFTLEAALPPLARLKTWEPWLHLRVDVPAEFAERRINDIAAAAEPCAVPTPEMERVLPAALAMTRNARMRPVTTPVEARERHEHGLRVRRQVVVLGVVVVLGGAGAAGAAAYARLRVVPVDVRMVSESVPFARAERSGGTIRATLEDDAWLKLPAADRTVRLRETMEHAGSDRGVTEVVVLDSAGNVAGVVKRGRGEPVVEWGVP